MIVFHREVKYDKKLNLECNCSDCVFGFFQKLDSSKKSSIEVIQKPIKRTLKFNYNTLNVTGNFFVSLPSIILKIDYIKYKDKVHMGKPIMAVIENNNYYELPLGNVYFNGSICMGSSFRRNYNNPIDMYKTVISSFWQSEFNHGVHHCLYGNVDEYSSLLWKVPIANPVEWAKRTKENPDWIPEGKDLTRSYPDCFEFDKEKYDNLS